MTRLTPSTVPGWLQFILDVLRHFKRNNGLMLAGAIAYYTLLSIIPALALVLLLLSSLIDKNLLLETLHQFLSLVTPYGADMLMAQVRQAINLPELFGSIGILSLILFSGMAFSTVAGAMKIIFAHRSVNKQGHSLVTLVLPYLYVLALAATIGMIITADSAYAIIKNTDLMKNLPLPDANSARINFIIVFVCESLLLTSFYRIMPIGKTPLKHALIGGVSATLLWEITRQLLGLWYSNVSQVNMIYGTLATVVILLLIIEAGAIILLLGAQVIADVEKRLDTAAVSEKPAAKARP